MAHLFKIDCNSNGRERRLFGMDGVLHREAVPVDVPGWLWADDSHVINTLLIAQHVYSIVACNYISTIIAVEVTN